MRVVIAGAAGILLIILLALWLRGSGDDASAAVSQTPSPQTEERAAPAERRRETTRVQDSPDPIPSQELPRDAESREIVVAESKITAWTSRLYGRVTDENDEPIGEAVVRITTRDFIGGPTLLLTQTDFDGCYEFVNPHRDPMAVEILGDEGDHIYGNLVAESPGRAAAATLFYLVQQRQPNFELNLTLRDPHTITGRVEWEGGDAVADANVAAVGTESQRGAFGYNLLVGTASTVADGSGRFELTGLASGEVRLAAAPHGEPLIAAGRFHAGDRDVTLTLSHPSGVVSGKVIGAVSEEPYPGIELRLVESQIVPLNPAGTWRAVSDAEGKFEFSGIPLSPGYWAVQVIGREGRSSGLNVSNPTEEQEVTVLIPEPAPVSGRVINALTDEPVPALTLDLRSESATETVQTDADGRFATDTLSLSVHQYPTSGGVQSERSIMFTVALPEIGHHFESGDRQQQQPIREFDQLAELELRVIPGTHLDVTVVDPSDGPIAGAATRLISSAPPSDQAASIRRVSGRSLIELGVSDAQGQVVGSRPSVLAQAQVVATHERWPLIVSPQISSTETAVRAEALPTTSLEVTVVDEDHLPVEGVTVLSVPAMNVSGVKVSEIVGQLMVQSGVRRVTNAEGRVTVEHAARCLNEVFAKRAGPMDYAFQSIQQTAETAEIDLTEVERHGEVTIVLRERTVHGVVIDGYSYLPIENARVAWGGSSAEAVSTEADGKFELPMDSSAGSLQITATHADYIPRTVFYSNQSDEDPVLAMQPEYIFRGRVLRRNGLPPPPSPIFIFRPSGGAPGWSAARASRSDADRTQEDGTFHWELPNFAFAHNETSGPIWFMALTADGEAATADHQFDLTVRNDVDLGTLTLGPTFTVSGHVRDTSGKAIEEATVSWEDNRNFVNPDFYASLPATGWATITEADGAHSLRNVPLTAPGDKWNFRVEAEGHWPLSESLSVEGNLTHDFILTPDTGEAYEIIVRTRDESGLPNRVGRIQIKDPMLNPLGLEAVDNTPDAVLARSPVTGPHFIQFTNHVGPNFFEWHLPPVDVGPEGSEETINLADWIVFRGEVTRAGEEVGEIGIRIKGLESDLEVAGVTANRMTGATGHFEVRLPPGGYQIEVGGTHHESFTLTPGQVSSEFSIDLPSVD